MNDTSDFKLKERYIIMNKFFMVISICILLSACSNDEDKRTSIALKDIDWAYLSEDANDMKIEYIKIFKDDKEFDISTRAKEFTQLMVKNPDKIYTDESDSTIKVYLRFNKISAINMLYTIDEYNGKENTFFVDESLYSKLEGIQDIYEN